MEIPAGAVRPLPPSPQEGDQFRPFDTHEGVPMDGPPIAPPVSSLNDESGGFQADQQGTPPPGQSSLAAATPPASPGLPPASGPARNRNPLTDLIDSEEQFVGLMGAIIRVGFISTTHVASNC